MPRIKVIEILRFLTETGLCEFKNEKYYLGHQRTHLDANSAHRTRHQINWRLLAIQHCENISDEELMYSASVSLSKTDFNSLREEMVEFIKKFLEKVQSSKEEEIACFNLDFFWI
jgi:hypothetical protein